MGNWYFVVGLVAAGATGYILDHVLPEKEKQFAAVAAWGMIALWGLVLALVILAAPVVLGVLIGKLLARGSRDVWPKLVAIWQAFD